MTKREELFEAIDRLAYPINSTEIGMSFNKIVALYDELAKDAERYRWLRVNSTQLAEDWSTHSDPESLDESIDSAIQAKKSFDIPQKDSA
jgi:hypothetical protein